MGTTGTVPYRTGTVTAAYTVRYTGLSRTVLYLDSSCLLSYCCTVRYRTVQYRAIYIPVTYVVVSKSVITAGKTILLPGVHNFLEEEGEKQNVVSTSIAIYTLQTRAIFNNWRSSNSYCSAFARHFAVATKTARLVVYYISDNKSQVTCFKPANSET